MTAPPNRQPAPPTPRPLAGTVLLYASLTVVMLALVLGWQWYQRSRTQGEQAPAPSALAPHGSAGQDASPTSEPAATAPATRPADAADSPNVSPMAIELSTTERAALGAVRDYIHRLQETAFFLLLGRASHIPKLPPEQYADLPRIRTEDILKRPGLYRAQPMRLKVRVFSVRKLESGKEMTPHRTWPVGSTAWELHVLDDVPKGQVPTPMILFLTRDPLPALGKPAKTLRDGEMQYDPEKGKRLELAGLFYKVHMAPDLGSKTLREYPVFIAWQVATPVHAGLQSWSMAITFGMIAMALLVGFIVLKKYLRQIRKGDSDLKVRYRPLRDTLRAEAASDALAAAEDVEPDAPELPPEETEVDPLLKQAAEEYRREKQEKEREQSDDQNRSG